MIFLFNHLFQIFQCYYRHRLINTDWLLTSLFRLLQLLYVRVSIEYEYEWNTDFSMEVLLCGWKIKSIVAYVGNNECEGCWWADKVPWDTSQAPRDLATEHLGKCGQTDESRLGALPPKGRVTFSGDNMGLQWHRKHPPPPLHCISMAPLLFSISLSFPTFLFAFLSLLISLILSAAVTAFRLFILLQVRRLD